MFKILVDTEEDKKQLLEASEHIHSSHDIDTSLPMVNTLAHLYLAPHLIEVLVPINEHPECETLTT